MSRYRNRNLEKVSLGKGSLPLVAMLLWATGCGPSGQNGQTGLEGTVRVDGSSTVFPITEAVAEEFRNVEPRVRVTAGISGTGGGFQKFSTGETDINDASRPIAASEAALAAENGIQYIELPVAFDGLSVILNPANDFVDSLTVEELKRIWQPGSEVRNWSDVRAGWPEREIHLYGPGTDSGTFDYFTLAIVGEERAIRSDFSASEDDNVLVQGTAGDRDALSFFGYGYYLENQERLKLVPIDGDDGPVIPSAETISDGTYQPLSRPIFLYVSTAAAARPEVEAFVRFYLSNAGSLVEQVGYVPLPEQVYELVRERFEQRKVGSIFGERSSQVGVSLETLLQGEQGQE